MSLSPVEILLVEDNEKDIELALHALRREKLANRVEVVRDGEEALDFLFRRGAYASRDANRQPRVVLLDLKLPKIDGLEVLRQVKQSPETQSIPVVVLTASREETDMVSGYRLGANSYIQKPVDFTQFSQTVREIGMFWLVVNEPPPAAAYLSKTTVA